MCVYPVFPVLFVKKTALFPVTPQTIFKSCLSTPSILKISSWQIHYNHLLTFFF